MIIKHYLLTDRPGTPFKIKSDHNDQWRIDRIFTLPSGWFLRLSSVVQDPPDPKPSMQFFPLSFSDPPDTGPVYPFEECSAERYTSALRLVDDSGWPQPIHWVKSTPISKPAEVRGTVCGSPVDLRHASSYRDQVTCFECLSNPED